MMILQITQKSRYALLTLLELALSEIPKCSKDIANRCQIPHRYLEHVLADLKTAQLVKSSRGAAGGYTLSKAASEIKVLDVLMALQGKAEDEVIDPLDPFINLIRQRVFEAIPDTLEDLLSTVQYAASPVHYAI